MKRYKSTTILGGRPPGKIVQCQSFKYDPYFNYDSKKLLDDKLIGCAAIILVGLCYRNQKNYLSFGLNVLKKISKSTLDNSGFPKSRNIKQLIFNLKYFILIREWLKESQSLIPENIDETIYYLGQGYAFICLLYTSPSPRDQRGSRMPSSA